MSTATRKLTSSAHNAGIPLVAPYPEFAFKNVTAIKVLKALKAIRSTCVGLDNIPLKLVIQLFQITLFFMLHIFLMLP